MGLFSKVKKGIKKATKLPGKAIRYATKNPLETAALAGLGYGGYMGYKALTGPKQWGSPFDQPAATLGKSSGGFLSGLAGGFGSTLGSSAAGLAGLYGQQQLGIGQIKKSDIRMGNEEDTRQYMARDAYDWQMAQDRGLTPQEFYGSAAAGGSATSGSASVLGNSQNQMRTTIAQAAMQGRERSLDRANERYKVDKMTEAQKYSADLSLMGTELSSGR